MASFNEWKEKAAGFALGAAGKAKDIASFAADKAKRTGRAARLKLEISAEKENMERAFKEIGKLYYEAHKDAPEGFFVQLCEEVGAAQAAIEAKEAELADLKSEILDGVDETAEDADFEAVVTQTEQSAGEPGEEPLCQEPACEGDEENV